MSRLPTGYTELTHIESTGEQHLNTLFHPNNNTRVVIDFQQLERPSAWKCIFGARQTGNENVYALWITNANQFSSYFKNEGNQTVFNGSISITNRVTVDKNKNVTNIGPEAKTNADGNFQTPYPMYLFASNTEGAAEAHTKVRLYSCQIYDNVVLVRDYVPCINPFNEVGLYDVVDGVFYGNAGTGAFIAGDVVVSISLGALFALRRMMATIKRNQKYVWAVYDTEYIRDDENAKTGSVTLDNSVSKYSSYNYLIVDGLFSLFMWSNTLVQNFKTNMYLVDISNSTNTVSTGPYLYQITSLSGYNPKTIGYKRYEIKQGKGDTELYRVESDTLDYPVDGEQDGLWYVMLKGERPVYVWDVFAQTQGYGYTDKRDSTTSNFPLPGSYMHCANSYKFDNRKGTYTLTEPKTYSGTYSNLASILSSTAPKYAYFSDNEQTNPVDTIWENPTMPGSPYANGRQHTAQEDTSLLVPVKGDATGNTVESADINAYPQDDAQGDYWYVYSHSYMQEFDDR